MAKLENQKPWKVEYAKSARSSCKTCKSNIGKEVLRLGKMVQATQFDGLMPMWNHATCILKKAKQIKSVDDVEGLEQLRWDDQQKIRQYVENSGGAQPSKAEAVKTLELGIEISQTSRATCKTCTKKISKGEGNPTTLYEPVYLMSTLEELFKLTALSSMPATDEAVTGDDDQHINKLWFPMESTFVVIITIKGDEEQVRISTKPEGQGARALAWHHAICYMELSPSTQVDKLLGWETLPASDQAAICSLVKDSVKSGRQLKTQVDEELKHSSKKAGTKRAKDIGADQKSKAAKAVGDVSTSRNQPVGNDDHVDDKNPKASDLETKLEAQARKLWELKDDLKKRVTTAELREMLEANGQDSRGSELDLRDRCADGMMFGALSTCPLCSGYLRYSDGMYRCHGYLSAWSKCSFATREPEHLKAKWKVPENTDNQYLIKWFKSQKVGKPARILPPLSATASGGSQAICGESQSLADLKVAFWGLAEETMEEWKAKIKAAGGDVHAKLKKDTNCFVVSGSTDDQLAEIRKARRMKVPIVREAYLVECFKKQKKLPFDLYKVEAINEASSMVTVKVKGRSAVNEYSGMQDTGHILEDGKSIYNTTLNMSDISTGINSYYILQIIEDDKSSDCYLFRKWGRVGNEKIGGNKIEEMSKSDAISEFKRLFLEKTGNPWQAWEQKHNFQKQPGRFFPLDIDYGIDRQVSKKNLRTEESKLAPPLAELMKMLFNVETYRAAMMEFEINMSEMPLGKLSKSNIQKGFEALTEIQNLLTSNTHDPSIKESLIVDASNRFFTVIPSIHPHVIRDEDDFKSKVKMLEALQDIEIASRLVGFDVDNDDSLDDKYKKLRCDIAPLPHDSADFQLIEKYLLTTHAPTHTDWSLELEEVFSLEREGEFDKFNMHRQKLGNRMLLWHGSRLTNFVGILSQGLRIAPPEAPATGYMFGKGIYFADLVSKSAQYCYTDRKNPVGLMLLSEVALGEVYELKKAEYMDKPPEGKHSTKGLGKKVPQKSEHVKWRDDVVVPVGKPVASNVRASELMYNEYIVYSTAQVKMQFLLKVRFHHKR